MKQSTSNALTHSEQRALAKQMMIGGLTCDKIYTVEEVNEFIFCTCGKFTSVSGNFRKIKYYEIPACFDIETTSFMKGEEKQATMYIWCFAIFGYVISGRTWQEWLLVCNKLTELLKLTDKERFIIYVHNLGYEFQFMRKWFEWSKIFAIEKYKPIYAITTSGIEFRCSYLLSGYSLESLSNNLVTYKCEKKVGDLNYDLMRNSKTILSETEMGYCTSDVKVVCCYIQELIEQHESIAKLPLTKTGFVRDFCREKCLYTDGMSHKESKKQKKYKNYRSLMDALSLDEKQYALLRRCFQGGFTHANPVYMGEVKENVTSWDFTSSYPAVMVCKARFPMSKGTWENPKNHDEFFDLLKYYACVFDVEFTNIRPKVRFDNYISASHCWNIKGEICNNGRVVSADLLCTTITEIDFAIIQRFYEWDKMRVANVLKFERGYLPTDLVKAILEMYNTKTQLKGVEDKEIEYMFAKSNLNSIFGACVTDICRDSNEYIDNEWQIITANNRKEIERNNKSQRRFLFYAWGCYITTLAKANLFTAILEFGWDYLYSDTDSIKVVNNEAHMDYINKYNARVNEEMRNALEYHGLDFELTRPKTIKGEEKPLGVWDEDGQYKKFKTLGAKRYMTFKDDKLSITVSGLNKKIAVPYIFRTCGNDIDKCFDFFNDEMYVPEDFTGKKIHTYIDTEQKGFLTDYQGHTARYHELSSVHLSGSDYSLSIAESYANYVKGVKLTLDAKEN